MFRSTTAELSPVPPGSANVFQDWASVASTDYLNFKNNITRDYDDPNEATSMGWITDILAQLKAVSTISLQKAALEGDIKAMMELGIRMYTGCNAKQDKVAAMTLWEKIVDLKKPNSPGRTRDHAVAASCLARAFWDEACPPGSGGLSLAGATKATFYLEISVAYGLRSPNALFISNILTKMNLRDDEAISLATHLWNLFDKRQVELQKEDQKRNAKVTKAPMAYQCAASGCGIQGGGKAALRRCGGKCPIELKPSYCSKECQRRDWPMHKSVCRLSQTCDNPSVGQDQTLPVRDLNRDLEDEMLEGVPTKERIIEINSPNTPGTKVRISSKTMSPAFMRQFRDESMKW